jgi:hypothetical protein
MKIKNYALPVNVLDELSSFLLLQASLILFAWLIIKKFKQTIEA